MTEYVYDNLYRRTSEVWKDGMSTVRTLSFTYDLAGQLLSASDPAADYDYVYDGLGRVTEIETDIDGLTPLISYAQAYNAVGNRTSLAVELGANDDFLNSYTYDNLQRLTSVTQETQSGGNTVASKRVDFAYNALGQFTDLDRYASLDTSEFVANTAFTYDLANRLTSLQHTQGLTALAGYDYTYDAAGRFTSIDSLLDGLTEYTHDAAGQLTDADHASITDEAYEYDDNGNRVMSGYVVGANNRISTNGVFDFEYDDEGNMVAKEEIASGERIEYEWDHRNRLIRIVFKDEYDAVVQVVEQTYDYQNRWVRSQIDADGDEDFDSERFFAYDGNQIVLDFAGDAASDLSHRYLWGPAVDQILADESVDSLAAAGDVLWPLTDHLGTTRDLAEYDSIENETSIASHRIFDSFGNLVSETNGSVTILFGFTARPFDVASGLQWNLNRWYISTLGVWMSEDPIGFKGDPSNLSRYVLNSPLDGTDPTGLDRYITQMTVVGGMHTGVAVDLWKKQGDGTYKKVGIKTFHFKADTSAYCYTNLLLSTLYGRGKVITYNGLVLGDKYITFSSYPEEDIAMLEYLEEQAANPSFYSAMAHNCVFWSVNAVNVGIDNSILRPDEEFEQKLPAADIGGPESPGDEFEMRLPAAEIGGPESPGH